MTAQTTHVIEPDTFVEHLLAPHPYASLDVRVGAGATVSIELAGADGGTYRAHPDFAAMIESEFVVLNGISAKVKITSTGGAASTVYICEQSRSR